MARELNGLKWVTNVPKDDIHIRPDLSEGLPKATETYSVAELEAQGIIGLYELEVTEDATVFVRQQ